MAAGANEPETARTEPASWYDVTDAKLSTCTVPETLWLAGGVNDAAIEPPIITTATELRTSVCTVPDTDWLAGGVKVAAIEPETIATAIEPCPNQTTSLNYLLPSDLCT